MKVITIRQPWAWLIVNGHKDVENRSWPTRYRGPLLIQASANLPSRRNLEEARAFARKRGVIVPADLKTGGIIGLVRLELRYKKSKPVVRGADRVAAFETEEAPLPAA